MESWHKLQISISDENIKETIGAMLMFNGAESVVDQGSFVEVYLHSENLDSILTYISQQEIFKEYSIDSEKVENTNWNAVWESSFEPIDVGSVHIRAEFHPKSDKTEIIIQPKMAFGTGHHETTFMMIDKMSTLSFAEKSVLDYGCGTGVLAVYAGMLMASNIDAIDIQSEAIENTHEHFDINNIPKDNLNVIEGDLDVLKEEMYDVILANINRHVLLENSQNLRKHLNKNGILLMSGILRTDRDLIIETYSNSGFKLITENQKGEWCMFEFN